MNGAHWHLVLNHLPIIIPVVGLLILVSGIFLKSEILKRAAYSLFILGAITAYVAVATGEEAEEIVEKISTVQHDYIEEHEEAAETFSLLLYILGGISIAGLWANWQNKSYANSIMFLTLAMVLVSLFYAKETGTTGGEIRHQEIRSDFQLSDPAAVNLEKAHEEEDED